MKVVINKCYGGFGLSPKAVLKYAEYSGFKVYAYTEDYETDFENRQCDRIDSPTDSGPFIFYFSKQDLGKRVSVKILNDVKWFHDYDVDRNDPILVRVVEELGEEADGEHASLKVVEIPDDVEYEIPEYDGIEHIAEVHRTWH